MRQLFVLVVMLAGSALLSSSIYANIYMDEDFEDASPFTDQDWIIRSDQTEPTQGQLALQGVNIRSWDSENASINPKVVIQNGGIVTGSRYFRGTQSLALNDSSISIADGTFPNGGAGEYSFLQFAISVGADSLAVADGTVVGRVDWDWSTDSSDGAGVYVKNGTTEFTLTLNLVKNDAGNSIDIVLANTGETIASLSGEGGDWQVITLLGIHRDAEDAGVPAPADITIPVFTDPVSSTARNNEQILQTGIHIFADSLTPVVSMTIEEINQDNSAYPTFSWGNNNEDSDDTNMTGWEFVSLAGTDVFVDDLFWSNSLQNSDGWKHDMGGRMVKWDDPGTEPAGPHVNRATRWATFD